VKKLQGEKNTYRIRVGGFRILYEIHDNILRVMVVSVADRKDVY
ncbi:MAG: type II toxin-antitoxin system RelE/ParE family toxin, partial [Candidatus Hydrogenedentes bacterium]|nr:type II toxin-antitoxin system RelE/ParE family toxin [Candidatus Hydrogenedentota bacterium]